MPMRLCCLSSREMKFCLEWLLIIKEKNRRSANVPRRDARLIATWSPPRRIHHGCRQRMEGTKQTKLGFSKEFLNSGLYKPLWGHCIDLKARIRSHTALNRYGLEGHIPETLITGQTGDISTLYEFEWFQWVNIFSLLLDILMIRCSLADGLALWLTLVRL